MSYQVLARKWRPRNFPEMVGQPHVLRALSNALENQRLHHAYLFTGTRGVGKTTIARIFAKSLNCQTKGITAYPCGECVACREIDEGRFVDLIEVDAASRSKVEETRDLLENVQYAPSRGQYKVYLIDEVHMLSTASFNALLKTLEEPPSHVKFLLATTDPQKIPPTILSRCLQFNLKRLSLEQISQHLDYILQQENVSYEQQAIHLIAKAAEGSLRDALSLLDQAIGYGGGQLTTADVSSMLGNLDQNLIFPLLTALATNDANSLLQQIQRLAEQNPDFNSILADLLSWLQQIAIAQFLPDSLDSQLPEREAILQLAQQLPPEDIQLFYQIGLLGRRDLPLAPQPRGGFEMVMLRMLAFRPVTELSNSANQPSTANQQPAPPVNQPSSAKTFPASTPSVHSASNSPPGKNTHIQSPTSQPTPEMSPPVNQPPVAVPENKNEINWQNLVSQLPPSGGMATQLAQNCALEKIEDKIWYLIVAAEKNGLVSDNAIRNLENLINKQTGLSATIKISIKDNGAINSPTQQVKQQTEIRQQQADKEIQQDSFISSLKPNFDATVVSTQMLDNL